MNVWLVFLGGGIQSGGGDEYQLGVGWVYVARLCDTSSPWAREVLKLSLRRGRAGGASRCTFTGKRAEQLGI